MKCGKIVVKTKYYQLTQTIKKPVNTGYKRKSCHLIPQQH